MFEYEISFLIMGLVFILIRWFLHRNQTREILHGVREFPMAEDDYWEMYGIRDHREPAPAG